VTPGPAGELVLGAGPASDVADAVLEATWSGHNPTTLTVDGAY
jgi:hypothetical protein